MIVMHVTYHLKNAGAGRAFCAALEEGEILSHTRLEDGCETYRLFYPADTEDQVFLLEIWQSEERMSAHRQTPQFRRLQEIKGQYVADTEVHRIDA